jgi:hypothetical protein
MQGFAAWFPVLFVVTKIHMMASSYTPMNSTDSKDSEVAEAYWLRTVIEDRAESAPPPAADPEDDR